ncbi:MFS transporter [Streptomyces griseicoloratus]|uniref:MFS transporter n=1 Tax=Streptomyces griseicoloratus TaxID=2752516 RepID=UPI001CB7556F|nr:MFS transporter [Streptomyces griseicoloratus]
METAKTTSPQVKAGKREWLGLAVLALPTILIALDMSVLHLAVPHVSADLDPSSTQLLWIVDIYGFLIAGLLITMGTLGDRIGRRRLLLIGAVGFGAASILAAYSTSAVMLIIARGLLGVAGATLMPSTMSLLRNMFHDAKQRNVAISVWMAGFVLGGALGPAVGGVMLEYFWWGSVFLLGAPVMALLVITGPLLLPEFRSDRPGRLDVLSVLLLLVGVLPVVYGIKEYASHGIEATSSLVLALGLAICAASVLRQRNLESPLLDLRLFGSRTFAAALAVLSLSMFVMAGAQFFLAQFLQMVSGHTPMEAGLLMLPVSLMMVIGILASPGLAQKIRPAYLMAGGLAIAAVGMFVLSRLTEDSGIGMVVAGGAIMSLGLGPTPALGTGMVLATAPAEKAGEASAIQETAAELGTAMGIALLGAAGTAVYRAQVQDGIPAGTPETVTAAAEDSIGSAVAAADDLTGDTKDALLDAVRTAFTDGIQISYTASVVIALAIALLVATLLRRVTPTLEEEGEAPQAEQKAMMTGDQAG